MPHPPPAQRFGGSSVVSARFVGRCSNRTGAGPAPAGPRGGCCEGTRGTAARAEYGICLIMWIYSRGLFLSMEAAGLTEAGGLPLRPPRCLKNNNEIVFGAGLV